MVAARWLEAVCAAIPATAVLALYHKAAQLWWLGDDPALLAFAERWRPRDYFLDPTAAAELPWHLLTPIQILVYDLELALWGERPAASHVAYLAVLAVASSVIFAVLRLWLERWAALAAAVMFVMGAPVAEAAPQLMVRHYVIGLTLAMVAAAVWTIAVRHARPVLAVLAAGLYLAAAAAKEVFVPLPLLLLLLPEGSRRERLRCTAPFVVALTAYLGWRWWMLGTLAGGYGFVAEPSEWPQLIPDLLTSAARGLFQSGVTGWALAAATAASLAALARRPAVAAAVVAAGLLVLAPILPVARAMAPRYLLVPWLWVAVVVVLGGRELSAGVSSISPALASRWVGRSPSDLRQSGNARIPSRAARSKGRLIARPVLSAAVLVFGFVGAAVAGGRCWNERQVELEDEGAAGRFVHDRGGNDLLRHPKAPSHYLEAVAAHALRHGTGGAGWFEDDVFLCLHPDLNARVWQQAPGAYAFIDITSELTTLRQRYCTSLRKHAPITVRFEWGSGRVAWQLGPYSSGGWSLVLADGRTRVEVPRQGNLLHGARDGVSLRARYEDDAGWITYSPELELDFTQKGTLEWDR